MRIPNVPSTAMFEGDETQRMSTAWVNYFTIISEELQHFAGTDGSQVASLTSLQINDNSEALERKMFYDEEKKEHQINNAGLSRQITTFVELTDTEITALPADEKKGLIFNITTDELFIGISGNLRQIPIGPII